MARYMYDSVNPFDIPSGVEMAAGYPDLWPVVGWERFSAHTTTVRIARHAGDAHGSVLDVEGGDAEPSEVPGWIERRIAHGYHYHAVYCSAARVADVLAHADPRDSALHHFGFWVAHWTGHPHHEPIIKPGVGQIDTAVAVQYENNTHFNYDVSVVWQPKWHLKMKAAPTLKGQSAASQIAAARADLSARLADARTGGRSRAADAA